MNKRKWIQFFVLGFFLVGLPAVSWYYLKTGFDYQKRSVSELQILGTVFRIEGLLPDGSVWTNQQTREKLGVMHLLDCSAYTEENPLVDRMNRLHRQFADREDVLIITFLYNCALNNSFDKISALFNQDINQVKGRQLVILSDDAKLKFEKDALKIGSFQDEKDIILFDNKGMIRNIYQSSSPEQFKRLVEHIAILMPRDQEDIHLRREREK